MGRQEEEGGKGRKRVEKGMEKSSNKKVGLNRGRAMFIVNFFHVQ